MPEDNSPRIPPLPRSEWTEDARDIFAYWEGPAARENGSRSNYMMVMANHPPLAHAVLDFSKYTLLHTSLTPRQLELTILRVCARYDSPVQWTNHLRPARACGITDAELDALKSGSQPAGWNAEDGALISAVDQLCDTGRIRDETWATLAASLSQHQLMDFLYTAGFYATNAWAFVVMGVQQGREAEAPSSVIRPA